MYTLYYADKYFTFFTYVFWYNNKPEPSEVKMNRILTVTFAYAC